MDILQLLPKDIYDAAVGGNTPSSLNVFATMNDLAALSFDNMAIADLTLTGDRTHDGDNNSLLFQNLSAFTVTASGGFFLTNTGAGTITLNNSGSGDVIIDTNTGNVSLNNLFTVSSSGAVGINQSPASGRLLNVKGNTNNIASYQAATGTSSILIDSVSNYIEETFTDGVTSVAAITTNPSRYNYFVRPTTFGTNALNSGMVHIRGGGGDILHTEDVSGTDAFIVQSDRKVWSRGVHFQIGGSSVDVNDRGLTVDNGASTTFNFLTLKNNATIYHRIGREGWASFGKGLTTGVYHDIDTTNVALNFATGLKVTNDSPSTNTVAYKGGHIIMNGATLTGGDPNIGLQLEADNHADGSNYALYIPANKGAVSIGYDVTANLPTSLLTVAGDIETIGSSNGLIVEDRTNGNRYRIYTDGGVLYTELVP